MNPEGARERLASTVSESGLIDAAERVIVLLSGGADSASLLAGVVSHIGASPVIALHLNYGLRPGAEADQAVCERLCAELGVELVVERPELAGGNLQAAAREARYGAAERLRAGRGFDRVAVGHTATDLAETAIYRLATSPGRRALLGMAPRRGSVVRPILALTRAETRRLASEAGLPFADDPSNLDPSFARNRIRSEVLPVLRELNPKLERAVAATLAELAEEAEVIEAAAEAALIEAGVGAIALEAVRIADLPAAVRRCALRLFAERAAGRSLLIDRERCAEILRLAAGPEGGQVDLGGGASAICESGLIRIRTEEPVEPPAVRLTVPGSVRFGDWIVSAAVVEGPVEPGGPEAATLAPAALDAPLEVRTWRAGDRIQPLGMSGHKSLQDLFTDAGVPRSLRHSLPVVLSGETIAWVAGVAVSDSFRLRGGEERVTVLRAHLAAPKPTTVSETNI